MLGPCRPVDTYSDQVLRDIAGTSAGRQDRPYARGRLFWRAGEDRARPLPRGRRPTDRLHPMRGVHDRLSSQRQEQLDKNYLWLAEKRGLRIEATPRSLCAGARRRRLSADAITHTGWFGRRRRSFAARNVILAAACSVRCRSAEAEGMSAAYPVVGPCRQLRPTTRRRSCV